MSLWTIVTIIRPASPTLHHNVQCIVLQYSYYPRGKSRKYDTKFLVAHCRRHDCNEIEQRKKEKKEKKTYEQISQWREYSLSVLFGVVGKWILWLFLVDRFLPEPCWQFMTQRGRVYDRFRIWTFSCGGICSTYTYATHSAYTFTHYILCFSVYLSIHFICIYAQQPLM